MDKAIEISYRAYKSGKVTMDDRKKEFKQILQEADWLRQDLETKGSVFPDLDSILNAISSVIHRCEDEIADADEWMRVMYSLEKQKAGCIDDME